MAGSVAVAEFDPAYDQEFPDNRVPELFRRAVEALNRGDLDEGRQALARLTEQSEITVTAARSARLRRTESLQKAIALDLQARSSLSELDVPAAIEAFKRSFSAREASDPETLWKAKCDAGRKLRELAGLTGHLKAAETAVGFFREAQRAAPSGDFPYNELGLALYELGRRDFDSDLLRAAGIAFKTAVHEGEQPDGSSEAAGRARINLAATLITTAEPTEDRREFHEATTLLQRVLNSTNPGSEMWARAKDNLAIALMGLDRTSEAIIAYKEAIKVWSEPREKARSWLNIGVAYTEDARFEEARASFEQALKLQPNEKSAPLFRAQVYQRYGQSLSREGEMILENSVIGEYKAEPLFFAAIRYIEHARSLRRPELAPFDWAASTVSLADVHLLLTTSRLDGSDQRSAPPELRSRLWSALGLYLDAIGYLPALDRQNVLGSARKVVARLQSLTDERFAFPGIGDHAEDRATGGQKAEGYVPRDIDDEIEQLRTLYQTLRSGQRRVLLRNLNVAGSAAGKGLTVAEVTANRPRTGLPLRTTGIGDAHVVPSAPAAVPDEGVAGASSGWREAISGLVASQFSHLSQTDRTKAETVVFATFGAGEANNAAKLDALFQAARTEVGEPNPPVRRLSEADSRKLKSFLRYNPWMVASGKSAAEFIQFECAWWLERGLALSDVRSAQPELASTYSAEISRNPERRVAELYVKPHKLPANEPRPKSLRRTAELHEEDLNQRRKSEREKKARFRAKKKSPHP